MKATLSLTILLSCILIGSSYTANAQTEESGKKNENTESKAAAERAWNTVVEKEAGDANKNTFTVTATGTGQTTGHIATLSVKNTSDSPISVVATGKGGVDAFAVITPEGNEIGLLSEESSVLKYPNGRGKFNVGPSKVHIPSLREEKQGYFSSDIRPVAHPSNDFNPGDVVDWIPPGGQMDFGLDGYCADVHLPPVPSGGAMPSVSDWVHSNDVIFPTTDELNSVGARPINPDSHDGYSVTNIPDEIAINGAGSLVIPKPKSPSADYNRVVSPFIFDALNRIEIAVDVLMAHDATQTPFTSTTPDGISRERETLIQQSLWIYTSALSGDNYTREDFADRMTAQYESNTGTKINKAPPETQDKLQTGIDDFWSAFELVGTSAKVYSTGPGEEDGIQISPDSKKDEIEKDIDKAYNEQQDLGSSSNNPAVQDGAEEVSNYIEEAARQAGKAVADAAAKAEQAIKNAQDASEEVEKGKCKCQTIDLQVETVKGDANSFGDGDISETTTSISETSSRGSFGGSYDEYEVDYDYSLEKGDKFSVKVSGIDLNCTCESGDCPDIHAKSGEHGLIAATAGKTKVKNTNYVGKMLAPKGGANDNDYKPTQITDDSAVFELHAHNNKQNFTETLFFQVSAYCSSPDCHKDLCIYKFKLKIRINQ